MADMTTGTTQFGTVFSGMFLDRIANKEVFLPLEHLERYQCKMQAYDEAHVSIFDTFDQSNINAVQELLTALYGVQDMQMEFIYRLGFQEGMRINQPEFLIEGLEK